jgi:predicted acylesterase/phospholipase RssA
MKLTLAGSALAIPARAVAEDVKTLDLVFEGGGIKGAAFCGALEVLESRGYSFRHIIGTSAGAITAALLAAGYTSGRMQAILSEHDADGKHVFHEFLLPPGIEPREETPAPRRNGLFNRMKSAASELLHSASDRLPDAAKHVAGDITKMTRNTTGETRVQWGRMLALLSTGAFASDAAFFAWLCERLKGSPLIQPSGRTADDVKVLTLREFHEMTSDGGVQLSVMAADVTGMKVLVLNHHTAPDVPVVDAVRMSMGIPIVWPEVEWKKDWGNYRDTDPMRDPEGGGSRIVDGGVLTNFPLRYLIEPRHMELRGVLGPPPRAVPTRILGLLLDETLPIPGVNPVEEKKHLADKLPAFRSLSRVLNAMWGAADQEAIDGARRPEVVALGLGAEGPLCRIPVKGYQTLDFDMDKDRMRILIASGKKSMEDYLGRPV